MSWGFPLFGLRVLPLVQRTRHDRACSRVRGRNSTPSLDLRKCTHARCAVVERTNTFVCSVSESGTIHSGAIALQCSRKALHEYQLINEQIVYCAVKIRDTAFADRYPFYFRPQPFILLDHSCCIRFKSSY